MNGEDYYHLLFLDGHSSYITREAIRFCEKNKIILLCLPSYSTHILQPLDVGIFGPLAQTYKKIRERSVRPGAGYHIDKIVFLKMYQEARKECLRDEFVSSAFRKSGYKPFDPDLILQNLPDLALKKDLESQEKSGEASFNGPLSSDLIPVHSFLQNSQRSKDCPPTPGNPAQVDHLLELATKKDMMDPVAFKLAKRLKKKICRMRNS